MSDSEDFLNELREEIKREKSSPAKKASDETKTSEVDLVDIDSRSGIRLKKRIYSAHQCDRGLQNVEFVPLTKLESHIALFNSINIGVKPTKDWSTIGVIDKCFPQDNFCVTRITDMRGVHTNVYITGKAYLKYQDQLGMGSVLAIKRPYLLKPTETNSSVALHVDQLQQAWVIGQSLDLIQCRNYIKKDVQCNEWTDIRSGEYCDKHLARVCIYSKNGRMELASGDSGFDIRWATKTRQSDGTFTYQAKKEKVEPTIKLMNNSRLKLKEAYYVKGLGLVATDGSLIKKKLPPKAEPTASEKAELQEFLKGRRDPGAEMIRKIKGIKEERPRTVLSKEALEKMGIGKKQLSKEEEESKKRSIEALSKTNDGNNNTSSKHPRYVYL